MASASVQTDRTADALSELMSLLAEPLAARPFTAKEVAYSAGNLTRSLPGRNETTGEVASALMLPLVHGLDEATGTTTSRPFRRSTPTPRAPRMRHWVCRTMR